MKVWLSSTWQRVRPSCYALLVPLVLCVGVPISAGAATIGGSYTLPTKYSDGTPLPQSAIKHIRVEVGTCTGAPDTPSFGVKEGEQLVPPPATSFSVSVSRTFGDFCARAITVTQGGAESDPVCCAKRSIAEPKPNPPTLLTIATIAYELRQYSNGTLRFVQVGTVPLGAACSTRLAGEFAVFDGARLTKPTVGGVIAARCAPARDS
jgi:hypothetical protein